MKLQKKTLARIAKINALLEQHIDFSLDEKRKKEQEIRDSFKE